jgi:hypothetical protein
MKRNFRRLDKTVNDDKDQGSRKVVIALLFAILFFFSFEFLLQVRSHLRRGQSVFNAITAETRYVIDPTTGIKVMRPNRVFRGSEAIFRVNSLGLRSAEISRHRLPGSLRLAVIGASTVMGAYAADNDKTFSAYLERLLGSEWTTGPVEVINAGIAGYTLNDQRKMLAKIIAPLEPDLVLLYPGFNDFSDYCVPPANVSPRFVRKGLPTITMPAWLLSTDMILKNTVFLRSKPNSPKSYKDARTLDLEPYRSRLVALLDSAKALGVKVALITNARAYQRDQPIAQQARLAETARYFNPCFDVQGLHTLYETHNRAIAEEAEHRGVPVLLLGEKMVGGQAYFSDSTHFSRLGEETAATIVLQLIKGQRLIPGLVD